MKNLFSGFHNPDASELSDAWLSDETLIVFDTNTFINLYGYAIQTRSDFFSILDKLQNSIWIPYHVALEYQRNRLQAIKREKAVFTQIDKLLGKIDKVFSDDFPDLALARRFPKLNENTEKFHKDVQKLVKNYRISVNHWDKQQPSVRTHDKIRAHINTFFDGRTGSPPKSQDEINEIHTKGKSRFELSIPPGYMDKDKEKEKEPKFTYGGITYERQYGDLIIWQQIIEKASEEKFKNVIFVTDDSKEDWWYILPKLPLPPIPTII